MQYCVSRGFRVVVSLGYPRSGISYCHIAVTGTLLADAFFLRQEGTAALEAWHLSFEVTVGEEYYCYRHLALLDECHELCYRHFYE